MLSLLPSRLVRSADAPRISWGVLFARGGLRCWGGIAEVKTTQVKRGVLAVALGWAVLGCGSAKESIVPTVATHEPTAQEVDVDPLALLPGGVVGFARLEAKEAFSASFGPQLLALAQQLAPLPPSTGFVIERDLERVYL